jgi:hypothetical protein
MFFPIGGIEGEIKKRVGGKKLKQILPSGKRNSIIFICIAVAICTSAFSWWILAIPSYNVIKRLPGLDNRPEFKSTSDSVIIGENFDTLSQIDEVIPGNWPRFRGRRYTAGGKLGYFRPSNSLENNTWRGILRTCGIKRTCLSSRLQREKKSRYASVFFT